MIQEEISVLLRLLIAHLLSDFVLPPAAWVAERYARKLRSVKLYIQAFISSVITLVLTGLWNIWWLPVLIFCSSWSINAWRSYRPQKLKYFLGAELLHLLVIALVWLSLYNKWAAAALWMQSMYADSRLLAIAAGYLVITWPLGMLIGIATKSWRDESGVNSEGLARAGMWIGLFERFLILTFILIDQYTAVGLLIAAKSILRFNDHERNTQKKTEYVLIGTLMSYATSVLLGWALRALLDII